MKESKFKLLEQVCIRKKYLKRIYSDKYQRYTYYPFKIRSFYKIYNSLGQEEYRYVLDEFDNLIFKSDELIKFGKMKLKKLVKGNI